MIWLKVTPRSSHSGPAGIIYSVSDDKSPARLVWKLNSPPQDGKANAELTDSIAKFFGVPKRNCEIRSGEKSRMKLVCVTDEHPEELVRKIEAALD